MPIYAYKCGSCGHAKDVLQKVSDAPLTTCPSCGAQDFSKQITAAGFQLKGSGWYVTDFRNNGSSSKSKTTEAKPGDAKPAETTASSDSKPAETAAAAPKSDTPTAAGGCGRSCACH